MTCLTDVKQELTLRVHDRLNAGVGAGRCVCGRGEGVGGKGGRRGESESQALEEEGTSKENKRSTSG